MEGFSKKKIMLVAGVIVGFVGIIVMISMVLMSMQNYNHSVIIDNLEECSSGISDSSKKVLFSNAYNLVDSQNSIEDKKTSDIYHAVFRDGSCSTKEYGDGSEKSYSTEAILDVGEAGYSFRISFNWVKNDYNNQEIDLGTIAMTCLNSDELLYGEFSCEENPMSLTKSDLDPILGVVPYFGDEYLITLEMNDDGDGASDYTIIIEYNPPESVYMDEYLDFGSYIEGKKNEALSYLEGQGIDLNNYKIKETYHIED